MDVSFIKTYGFVMLYMILLESIQKIYGLNYLTRLIEVNRAIKIEHTMEDIKQGVYTVTTKSFDDTTSPKQQFNVDGKQVYVYFGITRGYSLSISESPIHISSAMMFEFEPTSDYLFIYRLWKVQDRIILRAAASSSVKRRSEEDSSSSRSEMP